MWIEIETVRQNRGLADSYYVAQCYLHTFFHDSIAKVKELTASVRSPASQSTVSHD